MYQNDKQKVLIRSARLSYCYLTAPKEESGKYEVTLLIPKSDVNTLKEMKAAEKEAYEAGVAGKWKGARPRLMSIIHDGDGLRDDGKPYGEECKGMYVMTVKSQTRPYVCGLHNRDVELSPEEIYSGMWAAVTIRFYAYDGNSRKGVSAGLNAICKTRDDEPLGGFKRADGSDFADLDIYVDEEEDDPSGLI